MQGVRLTDALPCSALWRHTPQSRWLPLIQTLVYMYPIVTLMAMVVLNLEITIKKFMYYRLLSMRVLIDWENYMASGTAQHSGHGPWPCVWRWSTRHHTTRIVSNHTAHTACLPACKMCRGCAPQQFHRPGAHDATSVWARA